jgi:hypothetical protein
MIIFAIIKLQIFEDVVVTFCGSLKSIISNNVYMHIYAYYISVCFCLSVYLYYFALVYTHTQNIYFYLVPNMSLFHHNALCFILFIWMNKYSIKRTFRCGRTAFYKLPRDEEIQKNRETDRKRKRERDTKRK